MGALADALVSKGGYNQTDALNAEKGPRASELSREFLGGSDFSGGGSGNSSIDEAMRQQREGINQSVSALQGQQQLLPQQTAQRQATLNQQATTLESRYKSLIDEIKGQGAAQEKQQTRVTSDELARRGISLQGNLGQQEILNAVNPITQATQRNLTNTGIARESDLSAITQALNQLPLDEQAQRLAIQQAIGQTQAGGGNSAVQTALQLLQNQTQQQQFRQNYELQKQQLAASQQRNPLEDQLLQAQILATNALTGQRNRSGSSSSTFNTSDWE